MRKVNIRTEYEKNKKTWGEDSASLRYSAETDVTKRETAVVVK